MYIFLSFRARDVYLMSFCRNEYISFAIDEL
jgi:hypothetical protein